MNLETEYYKIGKFAKLIGVTQETLRNWDRRGQLRPHHIGQGGFRYYSKEQLYQYLGIKNEKTIERKTIAYCRVAQAKQKDELTSQEESIKTYMYAKGYSFEIISDIGSGIDFQRKGLNHLLELVSEGEVERIVVLNKERLIRVGYDLIETICALQNTKLEIVDKTHEVEEEELVDDLVQIMTTLVPGKRSSRAKKIVKEFLDPKHDVSDNLIAVD
jgi:predicted site-specific integrase-resolvase